MQKLGLGLKHTGKAVKGKFLSAVRWSMYSSEEVWDHDDLQNTKQNILFPSRVQSRIFRERYKNKLNCWETDLLRYVFRRGIVGKKWVLRRSQIVTQDLCCGMPHGSNVGNGRRRPPDLVFYPWLSQDRRLDFSSHKGDERFPVSFDICFES